jgi:4-aminobutyrate aminotransferase-like enzyme
MGLLVNAVQANALRLAPPLIVKPDEVDQALAILRGVLTSAPVVTGGAGTGH